MIQDDLLAACPASCNYDRKHKVTILNKYYLCLLHVFWVPATVLLLSCLCTVAAVLSAVYQQSHLVLERLSQVLYLPWN